MTLRSGWLVGELVTDPKHFFRSFTVKELG
jgi:hypothetical protein